MNYPMNHLNAHSDSGTDTESDYDSSNEYEDIAASDEAFMDSPKLNGKWYLASYFASSATVDAAYPLILNLAIQPATFFRHEYHRVTEYARIYGFHYNARPDLDIVQMAHREHGQFTVHNVLVKTFWLRMVQRHWRTLCEQRRVASRLKYSGVNTDKVATFPDARGMMAMYNRRVKN